MERSMAKSLAQIEQQIAKLQRAAEALKAKEVGGVVQRMKQAIAHYALTPQDLFGATSTRTASRKRAGAGGKKSTSRKPASPAKYRDEAGHSWTGHGRRPAWFKQAIAGGKTPEDLAA